jgi:hypothetical protein
MEANFVSEPLASRLRLYCHVEDPEGIHALKRLVQSAKSQPRSSSDWTEPFRDQLLDAILQHSITPKQLEELIGEDFDSQADVQERLSEIWRELYGDERIEAHWPSRQGSE